MSARRFAVSLVALLLVQGFVWPLQAEGVQGSGRIVFTSDRTGNNDIYVMDPDGTGQTNLSNHPADDHVGRMSPDGTKVAFRSNRDGDSEIYVMNADGTGQTNLTQYPAANDDAPSWSPDGTKIVFNSDRSGYVDIYVMNADGTGQTHLTDNPAADGGPSWSPDGTKIVFLSTRDNPSGQIYVMNADGTGQTRLTNNASYDQDPAWSPDGTRIAYYSLRDGNGEIYSMNADGSDQINLTNSPSSGDYSPVYAPDGTKIAFLTNRDGNAEVYTMNTDGSSQTRITNDPGTDYPTSWVAAPSPPAPLALTSPAAGSTVSAGQPVTIEWTGGDPSWAIDVLLIQVPPFEIAAFVVESVPNDGTFSWTFPTALPYHGSPCGNTFQFYVQEHSTPISWTYGPVFTVVCPPVNQAPVADAGPDQTVEATGATTLVTLDGSGSADADGDALTYTWTENGAVIAGPSGDPSAQVQLGVGAHTFALTVNDGQVGNIIPSGNPAESDETAAVEIVDTTAPVVTAPAAVTIEATGPQTAVDLGTASATDAVGVSSIGSDAPGAFAVGITVVTWTATDAAGNSGIATQDVTVTDTTPPVVRAGLTAISRGWDEDEDEDGNSYRVAATATDAVTSEPVVSAFITQPLTPGSAPVTYKKAKKNRIQVTIQKRRLQVQLEGPSQSALSDLWSQVLNEGGFRVRDGQEMQLVVRKDKDKYEAQYQLDSSLRLTSANGPGLTLVAWAADAAGNESEHVVVTPGKQARSGDDDGEDDDSRSGKLVAAGDGPAAFALQANYPNPFNPSTTLRYSLAKAVPVQLIVYNVMGQQVRVMVDQVQQAGAYQIEWDSRDQAGRAVAPGPYLYRLVAGNQNQTLVGRMLLVR